MTLRERIALVAIDSALGCEAVLGAIEFNDSAPATCKEAAVLLRNRIEPSGF
jgi:hypothetical protein